MKKKSTATIKRKRTPSPKSEAPAIEPVLDAEPVEDAGKERHRSTQLEKYDLRATICALFSQGVSTQEIATQLDVHIRTVYVHIEEIRNQLIATKSEYFSERASAYVDIAFDALHAQLELLQDHDFLRSVEPARITEIRKNSDAMARNIALFMAAGIGRPRRPSGQTADARNGDGK